MIRATLALSRLLANKYKFNALKLFSDHKIQSLNESSCLDYSIVLLCSCGTYLVASDSFRIAGWDLTLAGVMYKGEQAHMWKIYPIIGRIVALMTVLSLIVVFTVHLYGCINKIPCLFLWTLFIFCS